ncbi:MAG: rhodanese-like domain-containing protein [Saprospiraceae bacterium]|nr:rhodanese-like domain-containing protein [Saprospiraceae bacterium]
MFKFLTKLLKAKENPEILAAIQTGAWLVDVRTPLEFAAGHTPGSINIPLNQIHQKLDEFKSHDQIIVFCQSGNRSGQAKTILNRAGITSVINGGTWTQMNKFILKP